MSNDSDKSRGMEKKGGDKQERKSPLTAVGEGEPAWMLSMGLECFRDDVDAYAFFVFLFFHQI